MTDQELFEGIARRENRAFLYLYQQQQPKILAMVQRNNGDAEDARDIFQEALIALWTNISRGTYQLDDQARLSTYLFALCRNLWISRLRKTKRETAIPERLDIPAEERVDRMLEEHERISDLRKLMGTLTESCRQMLRWFYFDRISLNIIAERLDITEKSAKNNKYRCMQKLRTLSQEISL